MESSLFLCIRRSFLWFMHQSRWGIACTVGSVWAVDSSWQIGTGFVNIPASVVRPSQRLKIKDIYHTQLGCHSGLLSPPQALAGAPWPHPAHTFGCRNRHPTRPWRHSSKNRLQQRYYPVFIQMQTNKQRRCRNTRSIYMIKEDSKIPQREYSNAPIIH